MVETGTPRLDAKFSSLKSENRRALVTFITAGDPDYENSLKILDGLPDAGVDIIELGMPFSDPMADGPVIQMASQRALKNGQTLKKTLEMVRHFRTHNQDTPIILMGYYNPIYIFGVDLFLEQAKEAGVDGLIVVDLPPEEDVELCLPALKAGISFIRLATPTTDDKRLPAVLANTSGFVYYVSIAGITGTARPDADVVGTAVARIKRHSDLPIVVGFGVKTPDQAREMAKQADGVVIGSAIIDRMTETLDNEGHASETTVSHVLEFVDQLAQGVHNSASETAK